jgi:MATE family multidrug resistance protein
MFALPPYWLVLWHAGTIMRALGEPAVLADTGQIFLRAYMWCTAPWLLFQLLRNFVAALERPRVVLWLSLAGIGLNALLSWTLMFGHFGLVRLGLVGGGVGSSLTWLLISGALVLIVVRDRRFRRFHLFGRWWRFDRERTRAMARLGWPIGITLALEMGVFALAAYFMGWIGAPAVAAHAIALQLAALTFMVPLGLSQAATVRVSLALGRGDETAIARSGWTAFVMGVGFMAAMAVLMWSIPRTLVTLFLNDVPSNAIVIALAVSFLKVAAAFQLVDGYWMVGLGIGSWLAFGRDWQGVGIWVGLASGLAAVAASMLARWVMRGPLGLTGRTHP